jgi:DNA helicase-2/ATP-dependent DNA helicase PcrA
MNEIVISAAGGGKTTRIVDRACSTSEKAALVTYTTNNVQEIKQKLYANYRCIPPHVEVWSWYTFLLRELARPYQSALIADRIEGLHWVEGRSDRYANHRDIQRYYFNGRLIYSDKIAHFICECNRASDGAVLRRLAQRFDRIYIDEIQDLSGHDLDLLELILRSNVKLTCVGDHRQATYKTNNSQRNSGYSGTKIVKKFEEWKTSGLCALKYETETHRCQQSIVDLADTLFPNEPKTVSLNEKRTGHDGPFYLSPADVPSYVAAFSPQVLRLNVTTDCGELSAMNFGESKGMTFDRVLIFPHKLGLKWLASGDVKHVAGSAARLYVGITRARHSVAFVTNDPVAISGVQRFSSQRAQ